VRNRDDAVTARVAAGPTSRLPRYSGSGTDCRNKADHGHTCSGLPGPASYYKEEPPMTRIATILFLTFIACLGTALPAISQGTPAAVYLTIHTAIKQGNYEALLPHLSAAQKAKMTTDNPAKLIKMLQAFVPQAVQVGGQRYKAGKAVLDLTGTGGMVGETAGKQYGKALFVFEEGSWKLDSESWSNQPCSQWAPDKLSPFEL